MRPNVRGELQAIGERRGANVQPVQAAAIDYTKRD